MPTWSTAAVPAKRQFAYWREMICEAFLDLTPESHVRDSFRGRVSQVPLDQLDLARIESQPQQVRRTESDIARSPMSGFYANLQISGVGVTVQDGRTTVTRPGDLTLVDTSKPFGFEFSDDFQQLSLRIPASLLQSQLSQPVRTATRISTSDGVGASLRHALHTIDAGRLTPALATRLAVHACGLLAVALDAPQPATASTRRHADLLGAALDDIDEHLRDDDLSPARTAARLGISVRLVHQVFAGHEHSYAVTVRRRRLEQAHRDLGDRAHAASRIIDVAVGNGFADVTHFHRVFRETYGYTPAQRRRDAGLA